MVAEIKACVRVFAVSVLVLGAAGCSSKCVLVRSEYYDVTGRVFAPKPDSEDVPILSESPSRAYLEVGVVKIKAPWGTSDAAIDAELKHRAREAGADALLHVVREEDKSNTIVFCGKVFNTKKSIDAKATAIIYNDKGTNA